MQMDAPVTIELNGEPKLVPRGTTVAALLAQLGLEGRQVAVERNRELVRKESFAATELRPRDQLEIVSFVGGG